MGAFGSGRIVVMSAQNGPGDTGRWQLFVYLNQFGAQLAAQAAAVIGVALLAPPGAAAAGFPTSEVMLGCRAYVYEDNANFYGGVCLGAARTLLHLSYIPSLRPALGICAPEDATFGQAARIVTKFIEDHPERQGENFADLAVLAMRSAWPCGR